MRDFMSLRNQIAIAFCLITISTTGCTEFQQKVNVDLLEQNRGKAFKLGIVKVTGDKENFRSDGFIGELKEAVFDTINQKVGFTLLHSFSDREFGYMAKVVDTIPVAEICTLLSSHYSITIDTNVDKTISFDEEQRVSKEYVQAGNNNWEFRDVTITILNAQYGNHSSTKEFPDVVNVTYSHNGIFYYYDIDIISSGQEVVTLSGIVRTDISGDLNSFVYYAGRIGEALKRDLSKASKGDQSIEVDKIYSPSSR